MSWLLALLAFAGVMAVLATVVSALVGSKKCSARSTWRSRTPGLGLHRRGHPANPGALPLISPG